MSSSKNIRVKRAWMVLENGRLMHKDVDYCFNEYPRAPVIYFFKRMAQDENSEDYDKKRRKYIFPKGVKLVPVTLTYSIN